MNDFFDYILPAFGKSFKIEEISSELWYVGYNNNPNTLTDSEPSWAIQRLSKSGLAVTSEWALGGTYTARWDQRTSYFGAVAFANTKSVFFDGVNDYCRPTAVIAPFGRTSTFSVSMWVRPLALAGSTFLIGNMQNASNQGWSLRYDISNNTGKLIFNIFVTNNTNEIEVITTNAVLQIGLWTHIVVTYNGSGSSAGVTLYANGSSVALTSSVNTLSTSPSSATTVYIGSNSAAIPSGYFTGDLDEISIHGNTLTAGEVTSIYNGGDPVDLSALALYSSVAYWWRMGDGDVFPVLVDQKGGVNTDLQMYNSLSSQITGTVP